MNLHISKSRNAESFYICKSYVKANGSTSSMIIRKLGTLEQLLVEHPDKRRCPRMGKKRSENRN